MTIDELISYCPDEVEIWNKEINSLFYKIPIFGWLCCLIVLCDKKHHLRKLCVPKVFKFNTKVVNEIGRDGIVIDIDDRNTDGAGNGPIPYVVVKFEDGSTKKYNYSELSICK